MIGICDGKSGTAEICRANHTILRRYAVSRGCRLELRGLRGAVCRESAQLAAYQTTVRATPIARQLVLRVVPCEKFSTTIFEMASSILRNTLPRLASNNLLGASQPDTHSHRLVARI
jgi:hypothetical protein